MKRVQKPVDRDNSRRPINSVRNLIRRQLRYVRQQKALEQ